MYIFVQMVVSKSFIACTMVKLFIVSLSKFKAPDTIADVTIINLDIINN